MADLWNQARILSLSCRQMIKTLRHFVAFPWEIPELGLAPSSSVTVTCWRQQTCRVCHTTVLHSRDVTLTPPSLTDTVPAAAGLGVLILGSHCASSSLTSLLELQIDLCFQLSLGRVTPSFNVSRPPKVLPLHLCSHRMQNQSHPRIQLLLHIPFRPPPPPPVGH